MKTINFEIINKSNTQIYQTGYVEVYDDEDELPDWFYYDQNRNLIPKMFTHHDGIGVSQIGATPEQENEIDDFLNQVQVEYPDFVESIILMSEETENKTYIKGDLIIKINDGAKMECEIEPVNDYLVEVIPKFNGENLDLGDYMVEFNEEFDPWNNQDNTSSVEDGHILFEMSKEYFEDDSVKSSLMEDVNEEARRIYARALTRELKVYSKYGETMEQALDDTYDNEWLFKLSQVTDDTLEDFLRNEEIY